MLLKMPGGMERGEKGMSSAIERITAAAGVPDLVKILSETLSPTDLQTLMLAVYEQRSQQRRPADLLADYERSRFFGASPLPFAGFSQWTALAQTAAKTFEFLMLSPMTPLASCAGVASVKQDWSIPTARTGEVVSDPTNVLALEAVLRRRKNPENSPVHLGTVQRVVRPQAFGNTAALAHFSLLALVSSGRDTGSFRTEADMLKAHITALLDFFVRGLGAGASLSVSYTLRTAGRADARLQAITEVAQHFDLRLWEEADRAAVDGYYAGVCFHIWLDAPDGRRQLADGGAVDWGAKLLANGKERMVISGAGLDGLVARKSSFVDFGGSEMSNP